MILMGDEMGRTQGGNNNAYCHDNERNWLDWGLVEKQGELLRFAQKAIALRHSHLVLREAKHPRADVHGALGFPEVGWHGKRAWVPEWEGRLVGVSFAGLGKEGRAEVLYYVWNTGWESEWVVLPELPSAFCWVVEANTGCGFPDDIAEPGEGSSVAGGSSFLVGARSSALLSAVAR